LNPEILNFVDVRTAERDIYKAQRNNEQKTVDGFFLFLFLWLLSTPPLSLFLVSIFIFHFSLLVDYISTGRILTLMWTIYTIVRFKWEQTNKALVGNIKVMGHHHFMFGKI